MTSRTRSCRVFFFLLLLCSLPVLPCRAASLLEQCRDYFGFSDYEKAVETANRALLSPEYRKNRDLSAELLYYINEAGEEIAEQIQERINATNAGELRRYCAQLKKDLKLTIEIEEDGFYYIVRYKHEALSRLLKIAPESEHIEIIKLKRLLRLARPSLDPVYRFHQDKKLLNLYRTYISNYPGSRFRPNLLMKTADLCFHLYESGFQYKAQLDITDREIEEYYRQSRELYKTVMKEYPESEASRYVGEIRMNNVKLRREATTKSSILRVLPGGMLVRVVDRSDAKYRISNTYEYWFKIRLADGLEGWIYGIYLNTTFR